MSDQKSNDESPGKTSTSGSEWGHTREDHFGYKSEEERKAKRGLEDWEMVESFPSHQRGVPKWFMAVIAFVLLIAIGLSFPFWGDRPGFERAWFDWGFVLALVYLLVAGSFVYAMVRFYTPSKEDEAQYREQQEASRQSEHSASSDK